MKQRLLILLLVCIPSLGSDLLSKAWAKKSLIGQGQLSYLGDSFRLEYATNTGSWGGFLGQLPENTRALALVYGVGLFLAALIFYIVSKPHHRIETIALSLVLSGGAGNLVDRFTQGYVVDFLNMGLGSIRTNIFNLADVFIMVGMGLFLVLQFRSPTESTLETSPQH